MQDFDNLMDKDLENLDDQGFPKTRDLINEKIRICSRYPFRHKTTLHGAERKANLFGNWTMQLSK